MPTTKSLEKNVKLICWSFPKASKCVVVIKKERERIMEKERKLNVHVTNYIKGNFAT